MKDSLEREVAEAFLADAPPREPARLYEAIVTTTGRMRPRPRWLASLKEPPMRYRTHVAFGSPTARVAALAAVTMLMAILGVGALAAGAQSPSPATEEDPTRSGLPVEFSGHIVCGPEVQSGTYEWVRRSGEVQGVFKERDHAWRPAVTEMSDPRMEGTYHLSWNADNHASGVSVGSGTWRIENEDGAWQGSFVKADYPAYATTVSSALAGEGAYEGLTAIWESILHPGACNWDVRGVIIEGEPPAVPEPFIAE